MMVDPALRSQGLTRTYGSAGNEVHALVDADVEVYPRELVILRGPSGSGKTTLLNLLGGLDRPTSGSVWLGDQELSTATEDELAQTRSSRFGFVFQSFALLPMLTASENIEIPLRAARTGIAERADRVRELLDMVGLSAHANQRPGQLSGGQQQRVGIARALANRPEVLIADEPTGQLDSNTAVAMMELISELVHREGAAAVVSTHDPKMAKYADRTMEILDGRLSSAARHRQDVPAHAVGSSIAPGA
jgi:putative ABC transport system ATP-binding protein